MHKHNFVRPISLFYFCCLLCERKRWRKRRKERKRGNDTNWKNTFKKFTKKSLRFCLFWMEKLKVIYLNLFKYVLRLQINTRCFFSNVKKPKGFHVSRLVNKKVFFFYEAIDNRYLFILPYEIWSQLTYLKQGINLDRYLYPNLVWPGSHMLAEEVQKLRKIWIRVQPSNFIWSMWN